MTLSLMFDRVYGALSPRIVRGINKSIAFPIARSRCTLGVIAVITIVACFGIVNPDGSPRLVVRNNYEGDLDESSWVVQTIRWFERIFGKSDYLRVIVSNPEGVLNDHTMATVSALSDAMQTLTDAEPGSVCSLTHGPTISYGDDGIVVGPIVRDLHPKDGWSRIDRACTENPLVEGRLIAKNRTSCVIEVRVRHNADAQARIVTETQQRISHYGGPETIIATGQPLVNETTDRGIQRTMLPRYVLALLVILGYFYWSYRAWQSAVLPGIVITIGTIWIMGMIGWLGFTVNVMTSAIPVMIVIIGSSYAIQVHHHFAATALTETDKRTVVTRAMEHITPGILLAGITSALGTAGLVVFRVASIQEFGIFMTAGVLVEMLLVFTFIPAVFMLIEAPKHERSSVRRVHRATKSLLVLGQRIVDHYRGILVGVGVCVLIAIVGITQLRVDLDFMKLLPKSEPVVVATELCNKEYGGAMAIELAVMGDVKDPALLDAIDRLQRAMEREKGVGATLSFADILIRLHRAFAEDGSRLPSERDAVAQLLEVYQMGGRPTDFSYLVDPSYRYARVIVTLTTSSSYDHERIYKRLQELVQTTLPPNVQVVYGGSALLYMETTHYIVSGKIWNSISTVVVMFLFALIVFRSWLIAFLVILPPVVSSILIFGTMGLIGIALYMGTATVTSLTLGIGIDPPIHSARTFAKEKRGLIPVEARTAQMMVETGSAIFNDSMSNILGFLVFLTSPFRVVQEFGFLMTESMVLCLVLTYLLIPAVYALLRGKREGLHFKRPTSK